MDDPDPEVNKIGNYHESRFFDQLGREFNYL